MDLHIILDFCAYFVVSEGGLFALNPRAFMCELEITELCLDTVEGSKCIEKNALLVLCNIIASFRHIVLATLKFLRVL